ncbi:MAG: putative manganese-dependent inorganic diphosphatase [Lentisphaeraceae bacterium]|nr:putative manganese-dependent inorganic diphosphatase [Lentisphaeraceae bacterium]
MTDCQRPTIVIGHRNPDTDSIVSAIAYAALKRQQGYINCTPARAGRLTPQTEYILRRFNVEPPTLMPDLLPKVGYFLPEGKPATVPENSALWDALELMDHGRLPAIPVVDREGRYRAFLSHNTFTENIIHKTDPHRKAIIPTSINLLIKTLRAQPLLTFNGDAVIKSRILVAGSTKEVFEQVLKTELPTNAIAVVENRCSILELCIRYKVRAIVLTGAQPLPKEMFEKANAAGISVLISPYDIASTIYLTLYSMPVSAMTTDDIQAVKADDLVRDILPAVQASPTRSLPVTDDEGHVIGTINERDLYKQPNLDIIMVDHNELSLAVEGMDQFHIIEIIDHHKLGNFPTHEPINFINRVVGSTATIVSCLYQEQKATLTPAIAGLLLSAIITDTLALQSPTTTDVDRNMAEYLSGLLNLEVSALAHDIFSHASKLNDLSIEKILSMDTKAYEEDGVTFTVSQIETGTSNELGGRVPELLDALAARCKNERHFFAALMVTDITALNSVLLVAGDPRFIAKIPFPKTGKDNVFLCKGIMSRKKQLLPLLLEQLKATLGVR